METSEIIKKFGIRPARRLGQHFLTDEAPVLAMIEAAGISKTDGVLEIGPGLGILTVKLCERAGKVVAVEKDRELVPVLDKVTSDFKNICIIEDDVLKLDLSDIRKSYFASDFKVVANLPYYITSPIIMKIIDNRHMIPVAVVMVQKEVAERLVAPPGKKDYGILSIAVQLYADVDIICPVKRDAFIPPPRVDSAVVRLSLRQSTRVPVENEPLFFKVVEAAFGERRKTVKNSLKRRLGIPGAGDAVDRALKEARIDPDRRGETLSLEEFAALTRAIERYMG
ncbi:16S rRNA (adenine(1518)-N(6)/adenine(1519)-N(6))-dimethyltransferase RsmA [Thermoanaerobacterium sp. DL9XJH110]|uniref:16S rRNA (adenine(1518)-N(6)/adenine(1519)-N(6))- dimethyltransferase RsmA n=1 Tax=Thermoanaerobacterium sp. DL9XJH110 TaxID=3386643 RepID=UPI003BB6D2F2